MGTNIKASKRAERAFTLPEYMVTLVLAIIAVGAVMSAYIYGLKMVQFTKPKLDASDEARRTISLLTEEIRSAHRVRLGTRSGAAFTELAPFSSQIASAIRINPTTNTNSFVIYFWDRKELALRRTTDSGAGMIVASGVTNEFVFTGEDWRGNPYTNQHASMVVGVNLRFSQAFFPGLLPGPSNQSDFYQLRTKVNKRAYL